MLWLAKAATSTTQDTLRTPLALWPSGPDWENLSVAWNKADISKYFGNTLWVALGSWVVQLVVATTGGYVLSVLRPRYARVVTAAVLATLFVPGIVLLVPLFLTVLDLPVVRHVAAQHLLGACGCRRAPTPSTCCWSSGSWTACRPRCSRRRRSTAPGRSARSGTSCCPCPSPILGVVSVLAMLNAWKDFLWPLLVLPDPEIQPLSVRLPVIREMVELDVFLASLLISMALPLALFLVFQRLFLRGVGLGGAVKG